MTTTRRCPDCGVTLEQMKLKTADGFELQLVTNERREGLLGNFGMREKIQPNVYVCPECGLVRQYVDPE